MDIEYLMGSIGIMSNWLPIYKLSKNRNVLAKVFLFLLLSAFFMDGLGLVFSLYGIRNTELFLIYFLIEMAVFLYVFDHNRVLKVKWFYPIILSVLTLLLAYYLPSDLDLLLCSGAKLFIAASLGAAIIIKESEYYSIANFPQEQVFTIFLVYHLSTVVLMASLPLMINSMENAVFIYILLNTTFLGLRNISISLLKWN